uniref:Uncharacterized protein n=2 Tax=Lygus hesperus TaxID=30085 RepID=A0A146MB92_LYGHE
MLTPEVAEQILYVEKAAVFLLLSGDSVLDTHMLEAYRHVFHSSAWDDSMYNTFAFYAVPPASVQNYNFVDVYRLQSCVFALEQPPFGSPPTEYYVEFTAPDVDGTVSPREDRAKANRKAGCDESTFQVTRGDIQLTIVQTHLLYQQLVRSVGVKVTAPVHTIVEVTGVNSTGFTVTCYASRTVESAIHYVRWSVPRGVQCPRCHRDPLRTGRAALPEIVIDNIPAGVHVNKYRMHWNPSLDAVQGSKDLVLFLQDFIRNQASLVIRSLIPPITLPSPQQLLIPVLGTTFTEIVLNPYDDVLVLLYTPLYSGTRAIFYILHQVQQYLLTHLPQKPFVEGTVRVAIFDLMHNDLPVTNVSVPYLPQLLLFPAAPAPKHPFYYSHHASSDALATTNAGSGGDEEQLTHFSLNLILKFIHDHGSLQHLWPQSAAPVITALSSGYYLSNHTHGADVSGLVQ